MAAGTVPCHECGQPVPADRLACPNCGALVNATADARPEVPAVADPAPAPPGTGGPPDVPDADPVAVGLALDESPVEGAGVAEELETGGIVSAGVAPGGVAPGGVVPGGLVPGAYLPPSTVHRPVPGASPPPQMPLATSPAVGEPPVPPIEAWQPRTASAPNVPLPASPPPPGRASLFADLPFDAPDSLTEWLVALGSVVAALSFLLPWIPGVQSYVSSWGLASISHLPILGLLIVTAVLAILPNQVAPWLRSGVLGLIGGSIFLGLLWPIVAGDFGPAAFGAIVGAVAAIILMAGGVLAASPKKGSARPD